MLFSHRSTRWAVFLLSLIQLRALAFAFPATWVLLLTLGLLELAVELPAGDLSYRHVWALMPILYFAGVLLAKRQWTQAELGERLGVSRQTVNAIETGRYDASLPLAFQIARLFGLSIQEVFEHEQA